MSKIALSGNASGTGTLTIAAPNTSTDRTLTLPDATGTLLTTATPGVPINGPAFSSHGTALQSFANNTFTKVAFNTKEFDTNTNFDTTNNRFTPTVAGYYLITASCSFSISASGAVIASVYKNGSEFKRCFVSTNNSSGPVANISSLVYANGSTDYFEIYAWQNSGGALSCGSASSLQCFTASLIRAA